MRFIGGVLAQHAVTVTLDGEADREGENDHRHQDPVAARRPAAPMAAATWGWPATAHATCADGATGSGRAESSPRDWSGLASWEWRFRSGTRNPGTAMSAV